MDIQEWCGIELFYWKSWDEINAKYMEFHNPKWYLDSMKKYNGKTIGMNLNGRIFIFSTYGIEIIWSGYVIDIPEVREKLGLMSGEYIAKQIPVGDCPSWFYDLAEDIANGWEPTFKVTSVGERKK